jgi:xanthine dehydrogenase YagS FAD-binding subunit
MRPFRYHRAETAVEAVAALAGEPGARFLGGGTNLVDLMRLGVETPPLLVDVGKLPHDRVEGTAAGGVRIGAAVRNSDLAGNQLVRSRFPVLAEALLAGASGQLRNLATVGGNLMQRTRCAYFQDVTKVCNKRAPGTGCSAREGEHHNHAILGHSEHCVATHPSDLAVALAALDAAVDVDHGGGRATVPLSGLYRLPGDEPHRDTVLGHGELITAVEVPPLPDGARSHYRKVRERASFSFAVVSVAAAVELDDGVVRRARLALGGVAHVPWRAAVAERLLQGQPATRERFARAAEAELAAARPLRDNGYKVTLARNLIVQTLSGLAEAGP